MTNDRAALREDWRGFARAADGDAWWHDRATRMAVATDLEQIDADTWRTDMARLPRHIQGAPLSA